MKKLWYKIKGFFLDIKNVIHWIPTIWKDRDWDYAFMLEMERMKYYPFQARALRAYFLFDLARRYGDIPMPLKMLSIEEANSIEKTPFADVISFIVFLLPFSVFLLPGNM